MRCMQVTGIPSTGVSRESLKDAVKTHGTALYIDFSFGEVEAWIRYFIMAWHIYNNICNICRYLMYAVP